MWELDLQVYQKMWGGGAMDGDVENDLALSKVLPASSMLLFLARNVDKMTSHPLIHDRVLREEGMVLEMLDLKDALQVLDIIPAIGWQLFVITNEANLSNGGMRGEERNHLGLPADPTNTIWALPPTVYTSSGLSRPPFNQQLGLPADPTNTIWALPLTVYISSGLSHLPFNQQLGLPADPTNTMWALPPTVYTSSGLSHLPFN
ncbi:hypothetical protein EV702DRAFT_1048939 [Suillus placidus]|uniref:Uncharacterized protein n=1 Tax=Suillus placidus TaxID=48579 RepID=A0A9P6ZLT8_9AGAM|nr:hypothetical protein EV702DRAFT_1048939 [Suillus placidus]